MAKSEYSYQCFFCNQKTLDAEEGVILRALAPTWPDTARNHLKTFWLRMHDSHFLLEIFRIFPRYFFLSSQRNISGKSPIFSAVEIPCWSNGRNISGKSPIIFYVSRRGKIFRGYPRYTGASSNIRLLQNVKKYRRSLQKEKYRILKNQ